MLFKRERAQVVKIGYEPCDVTVAQHQTLVLFHQASVRFRLRLMKPLSPILPRFTRAGFTKAEKRVDEMVFDKKKTLTKAESTFVFSGYRVYDNKTLLSTLVETAPYGSRLTHAARLLCSDLYHSPGRKSGSSSPLAVSWRPCSSPTSSCWCVLPPGRPCSRSGCPCTFRTAMSCRCG